VVLTVLDGGNAGNIFITVAENDLDLLVACKWNTSGGRGGASGTHGMPGDGGIGGRGGNGCTWTERYGDRTYYRQRAPGAPGAQGVQGAQPSSYLMGGRGGKEGSIQIRVLNNDLTEGTYGGTYELEVVSFDVLDENDDGINEPGEYLLVRNIKVKNKGRRSRRTFRSNMRADHFKASCPHLDRKCLFRFSFREHTGSSPS
jgi:hypothetical protein